MNTVISSISSLFKKSRQSLMYSSMAALTMGVQEIFEKVVFNCPCKGHFAYAQAFLWVPAILLFFPGVLLSTNLWRSRTTKSTTQKPRKRLIRRYFKTLFNIFDVMTRASIAPVAWLVVSFLQQQYYTCAYFGPPLKRPSTVTNATDRCHFKLGVRSVELEECYKARSQIAGWSLLLIAVFVLFASVCIRRCITKGKYLRIPSLEYYRHVEAKEALEQFHTIAKKFAKEKATKEIRDLFKNVTNKDVNARLKEVGANIHKIYHKLIVTPPESPVSPSYRSPQGTTEDPPQFPSGQSIPHELIVSDGSEEGSFEVHSNDIYLELSSQTNSGSQNSRQLTRIRLRQDSIDMC